MPVPRRKGAGGILVRPPANASSSDELVMSRLIQVVSLSGSSHASTRRF
jgi:hypothetical protein